MSREKRIQEIRDLFEIAETYFEKMTEQELPIFKCDLGCALSNNDPDTKEERERKSSKGLVNLIDKMIKPDPNEKIVKALKGETVINPNLTIVKENFKELTKHISKDEETLEQKVERLENDIIDLKKMLVKLH